MTLRATIEPIDAAVHATHVNPPEPKAAEPEPTRRRSAARSVELERADAPSTATTRR